MSEVYTPDSTGDIVTSYTEITDDDGPPAAALWTSMREGMADNIARLAAGTRASTSPIVYLHEAYPCGDGGSTLRWQTIFTASKGIKWSMVSVDTGGTSDHSHDLAFPLHFPDAAELTLVSLSIAPNNTHGALPDHMPQFDILEEDPVAFTMSTLCTITDTTATFGAYNSRHTLTATTLNFPGGDPIVSDRANLRHWIRVSGERGTNAVATTSIPFVIHQLGIQFTTTKNDPRAT